MTVKVTFGEILDAPALGSWDKFCERHGYNVWIINEGQADKKESVEITVDEAYEYGLLKKT